MPITPMFPSPLQCRWLNSVHRAGRGMVSTQRVSKSMAARARPNAIRFRGCGISRLAPGDKFGCAFVLPYRVVLKCGPII